MRSPVIRGLLIFRVILQSVNALALRNIPRWLEKYQLYLNKLTGHPVGILCFKLTNRKGSLSFFSAFEMIVFFPRIPLIFSLGLSDQESELHLRVCAHMHLIYIQ